MFQKSSKFIYGLILIAIALTINDAKAESLYVSKSDSNSLVVVLMITALATLVTSLRVYSHKKQYREEKAKLEKEKNGEM